MGCCSGSLRDIKEVQSGQWAAGRVTKQRTSSYGAGAPSVRAKNHYQQLIDQRTEACHGGRAHKGHLEVLKRQERSLPEALRYFVKKCMVSFQLRPPDWEGARESAQCVGFTSEADIHPWVRTPAIILLLHLGTEKLRSSWRELT